MNPFVKAARRKGIRRKYLRLAALYRRAARGSEGMDFSLDALAELHRYESTGKGKPARNNGWAYGKLALDITVSDAVTSIKSGDFCKAEFYRGPTAWYWKRALADTPAGVFFPFSQEHRSDVIERYRV